MVIEGKHALGWQPELEGDRFMLYDPNSGKLLKRLGEFTDTYRWVENVVWDDWCLYESASMKIRKLFAQKPQLLEKIGPGAYPLINIGSIWYQSHPSSSLESQLENPEQVVVIERIPMGDIVERNGARYLLRGPYINY